ncbi:MAG: hypothetical protein Q4B43_00370 [Bacteroidota bacterium]|nr:hypothetical protein [Bacteroidota bacterium]
MATYNKRGYKQPKPKEEINKEQVEADVLDATSPVVDGDSTTEEVFNTLDTGAKRIENWVMRNQKPIFGAIGGLVLIVGGIFAYNKFVVEPKQEQAVNEMYQAELYFSQATNGVASDSLYNLALNGGEGKLGFLKIQEHYKGTDAANLASYYAGVSYLNLHKYKEAITELEKFKSDDEFLGPFTKGLIGDAFVQNDQLEEGLEYYEKAFAMKNNTLTTPRFLLKAGQVALTLGKKDKALQYFSRIQNEFGGTNEAQNIEALIVLAQS